MPQESITTAVDSLVKFVKEKEQFTKKIKEINIQKKEFEIKNIKLIKSTLGKEGPFYEEISNFC